MSALRHLLRRNAAMAWMLIAGALLMKAIVPAGFMPTIGTGGMAMTPCPGMAGVTMAHSADARHTRPDLPAPTKKADAPCAFAGLTAPGLAGVDIVLLANAVVAILAAAMLPRRLAPIAPCAFLRPPLRGPPARR